jgi:hypothetical protein
VIEKQEDPFLGLLGEEPELLDGVVAKSAGEKARTDPVTPLTGTRPNSPYHLLLPP